jgi:apurinic endonuclease APN1
MTQVLANTSEETWLIIENSAGAGNHIGATFEEIGRMIAGISSDRVRVCIDTQHTLAAGYDITTSSGIDSVMNEFDSAIGLDRLAAVHANDSKTELGSGKDRHENIGLGSIGSEGFANIMAHPAFADVPFMLEVPGIEGNGPDVPNIDALKAIRARLSD